LAIVLNATRDLDYVFVDCGANYGFWSVLASDKEAGARKVVAIEPSPTILKHLTANWDLNDQRFQLVTAAVDSETGNQVEFSGRDHAGAHIGSPLPGERRIATVRTITVDDALLNALGGIPRRALLKLDVEGAEIAALTGAREVLAQDCLIAYEDHGRDKDSKISDYVLHTLQWPVFFVDPSDRTVSQIRTLGDVSKAKAKNRKSDGTNFFACKPTSEFISAFC
jgi:FkbM family methyltransferase